MRSTKASSRPWSMPAPSSTRGPGAGPQRPDPRAVGAQPAGGGLLKGLLHCGCPMRLRADAGALGQGQPALPLLHLRGGAGSGAGTPARRSPSPRPRSRRWSSSRSRRSAATLRLVTQRPGAGTRQQGQEQTAELEAEGHALEHDLARWQGELHLLSGQLRPGEDNGSLVARLAELQERVALVVGRVQKVRAVDPGGAGGSCSTRARRPRRLALFDPVWQGLSPGEQARVLGLLVQRVDYDGARGRVSITFHPAGIQAAGLRVGRSRGGTQRSMEATILTIEREVHFSGAGGGVVAVAGRSGLPARASCRTPGRECRTRVAADGPGGCVSRDY